MVGQYRLIFCLVEYRKVLRKILTSLYMDKFSDRRNRLTLVGSCNLDIIVTKVSVMVEAGFLKMLKR